MAIKVLINWLPLLRLDGPLILAAWRQQNRLSAHKVATLHRGVKQIRLEHLLDTILSQHAIISKLPWTGCVVIDTLQPAKRTRYPKVFA